MNTMKPFADLFKEHKRRLEKMPVPTLYDMIHGERQEVLDACMRMLQSEHELVHQIFCQVMKDRQPKEMLNIVHPNWIEWSNKNSKMMEFMKEHPLPAINNHVCPHCKNERVSKDEKSCWLCGGML